MSILTRAKDQVPFSKFNKELMQKLQSLLETTWNVVAAHFKHHSKNPNFFYNMNTEDFFIRNSYKDCHDSHVLPNGIKVIEDTKDVHKKENPKDGDLKTDLLGKPSDGKTIVDTNESPDDKNVEEKKKINMQEGQIEEKVVNENKQNTKTKDEKLPDINEDTERNVVKQDQADVDRVTVFTSDYNK